MIPSQPDRRGYFGSYGGRYVPDTVFPALDELDRAYRAARRDPAFRRELGDLLRATVGRPTPLTRVLRFPAGTGKAGARPSGGTVRRRRGESRMYLKREDLCHTGAHKINNTVGQVLLARRMGKRRVIAETGAGQHGVATATACALFGLKCTVYMGSDDVKRQAMNVYRMRLLGAEVVPVESGTRTLKDAINEAMRDWVTRVRDTYYCIGSAVGPHPYPLMVRDFQSVIGLEAKRQILKEEGRLPDLLVACVGGGSNAMGLFHPFLDTDVAMVGVEAGGRGPQPGRHGATLCHGRPGILHGALSYLLQDAKGQVLPTHSVSAGLDYPGVGPEHACLKDSGRVRYTSVPDDAALEAFHRMSELEGILPALESSHALAYALRACRRSPGRVLIVNLSGRGDKDLDIAGGRI
ncbi:MAG: tryptophan synthase subunit beta [bacterium]|nr:tryptophan synthase subunit beta [bacterium]